MMFLVADRVLYLIHIKNKIEWVQSPLTHSSTDVVDSVLYLINIKNEIEWVQSPLTHSTTDVFGCR